MTYELMTGKLPYQGKGFGSARDVAKLSYISAREHNTHIPIWVDGALRKALQVRPTARYERLSEFIADLKHPSPQMTKPNARPLLERNPVAFWRAAALLMFAINLVFYYFTFV